MVSSMKSLLLLVVMLVQAGVLQGFTLSMASKQPLSSKGLGPAASSRGAFLQKAGRSVAAAAALAVGFGQPALAETADYTDNETGTKLTVPRDWKVGDVDPNAVSGRRRLFLWTDPKEPTATNAFVAYTPVRGDFTSLGSFGSCDDVAGTILPNGKGISSKLIASSGKGGKYYYEYTVSVDGKKPKHIFTVWGLVPGTMLVTVSAQCNEEDLATEKDEIEGIVNSFTLAGK